jgi:transposase
MTRRQKDPLRPLTSEERSWLIRISRSHAEPASHLARARALLAVAGGRSYTVAAKAAGRRSGDAVSQLVSRFNREGIAAIEPRHGGGPTSIYTAKERKRILQEARRAADREKDGTATWSLSTLRRALRRAPDGLPMVSTYTIWKVLKEAGFHWQRTRSWCETGRVERKRKKSGEVVEVIDPDAEAKKLDRTRLHRGREAGFIGVVPRSSGTFSDHALSPGSSWEPQGKPARQPHQHLRNGTAKLMSLFHPATGRVRVKGVRSCANAVLHPWLKEQLTEVLKILPPSREASSPEENRARWKSWQEGLVVRVTLPKELPPLRMLVVLDNLTGHKSAELLLWMFAKGIMVLYTPLGASWLNMSESMQRILARRALEGHYPKKPQEIIEWLEEAARGWNQDPTPFEWGGRRAARRERARRRRHAVGGSGACTRRPIRRRRRTVLEKWRHASQMTH